MTAQTKYDYEIREALLITHQTFLLQKLEKQTPNQSVRSNYYQKPPLGFETYLKTQNST